MQQSVHQRWIMHVDMDAFYASVEILDNPKLKGLPVIVGGRSARGVVSTCSYEARKFGVHSAMPLFEAKRLCPQGVFVPVRMGRYAEMSAKIMKIFRETSPLVEQLSIDEAFVDLTGMERLGGAEAIAHQVQDRIQEELKLSAGQTGLGYAQASRLCENYAGRSGRAAGSPAGDQNIRHRTQRRREAETVWR